MSYQVGSACYSTPAVAAAASSSVVLGSVVQHGGAAFVVDVSSVTASSITYSFTPVAGGAAVVVVSPYTAQPCGLLDASDAIELGWGVAAIWLGVYGVMFLGRSIRLMMQREGSTDD